MHHTTQCKHKIKYKINQNTKQAEYKPSQKYHKTNKNRAKVLTLILKYVSLQE